jgi:hypothetical protein
MRGKVPGLPSRRDLFGMGSAAGALALIAKPDYAQSVGTKNPHESREENVRAFGAIGGAGTVGFSDCTFVQWEAEAGRAAIEASGGRILIRGCEFLQKKPHISLGDAVDCAVITGNVFAGPARASNTLRARPFRSD